MVKSSTYYFKIGVILFSLLALGACRSSGEADEGNTEPTNNTSSNNNASTRPTTPPADPQRAAREAALRTTVFYFDFDVAEFKPADRDTLTFHARDLASNSNKRIRLEGHADERGTREYNLALGERRANGIMNFLIVNGASRSQLETVSYGEERPERTGSTDAAYAANRRVEIVNR